jgi:hypothetical protein
VSLPTQAARPGPDNRRKPRLLDLERRIPARDKFAPDSPLEERGFEPSVPLLRKGLPGIAEGRSRNDQLRPVLSAGPIAAAGALYGRYVHRGTEISNLVCSTALPKLTATRRATLGNKQTRAGLHGISLALVMIAKFFTSTHCGSTM